MATAIVFGLLAIADALEEEEISDGAAHVNLVVVLLCVGYDILTLLK